MTATQRMKFIFCEVVKVFMNSAFVEKSNIILLS